MSHKNGPSRAWDPPAYSTVFHTKRYCNNHQCTLWATLTAHKPSQVHKAAAIFMTREGKGCKETLLCFPNRRVIEISATVFTSVWIPGVTPGVTYCANFLLCLTQEQLRITWRYSVVMLSPCLCLVCWAPPVPTLDVNSSGFGHFQLGKNFMELFWFMLQ